MSVVLGLATTFFVIVIVGVFLVIIARFGTPISTRVKFICILICCGLLLLSLPVTYLLPESGMIKSKNVTIDDLNRNSRVFNEKVGVSDKYNDPELNLIKTLSFEKSEGTIKIDRSASDSVVNGCSINNDVYWRQKETNDGKITVYIYSSKNYNGVNFCMKTLLPIITLEGNTLKVKALKKSNELPDITKYNDIYSFDDSSAISQFEGNVNISSCFQESASTVVVLVPKGVTVVGGKDLKLPDIKK